MSDKICWRVSIYIDAEIFEINYERKTDKCIWINGRRCNIRSGYENYFFDRLSALSFMIDTLVAKIKREKEAIEDAKEDIIEYETQVKQLKAERSEL